MVMAEHNETEQDAMRRSRNRDEVDRHDIVNMLRGSEGALGPRCSAQVKVLLRGQSCPRLRRDRASVEGQARVSEAPAMTCYPETDPYVVKA